MASSSAIRSSPQSVFSVASTNSGRSSVQMRADCLIIAGIQTGASEQRRKELIACVQSFYQA